MGEGGLIKRLSDGRWFVDLEPRKGTRFRKRFSTKSKAMRFESVTRARFSDTDFLPVKDGRRLSDLVALWHSLHGQTLTDAPRRLSVLRSFVRSVGDPLGRSVDAGVWAKYRMDLLASGHSAKTANNHLSYVRAVFNELRRLGEVSFPNPLASVRPLKLQERQLSYLTQDQIVALLDALKFAELPHARMVTLICLATGCRWGEAQALEPSRVRDGLVTFVNTKSKRARSVPVSAELSSALLDHFKRWGAFSRCEPAFRKAAVRAGIDLPRGQSTHVLRHTFAAHFIMSGGNLLVLQRVLGHSTINMTMRYAHLAPDHLREVLTLGAVRDFRQFFDTAES